MIILGLCNFFLVTRLITHGLQIDPLRKRTLQFFTVISFLNPIYTPFSVLTNLCRHLAPVVCTVSLLNEILSMSMTQRCYVLPFKSLYLFAPKSILKTLTYPSFNHPHFERYPFPAERSLTLTFQNKARLLLLLSLLLLPHGTGNGIVK